MLRRGVEEEVVANLSKHSFLIIFDSTWWYLNMADLPISPSKNVSLIAVNVFNSLKMSPLNFILLKFKLVWNVAMKTYKTGSTFSIEILERTNFCGVNESKLLICNESKLLIWLNQTISTWTLEITIKPQHCMLKEFWNKSANIFSFTIILVFLF